MASRRLQDLDVRVAALAAKHIAVCKAKGVELLVYCTLRDEKEQARLYRTNRSAVDIERKIEAMKRAGYPVLAKILDGVGPQPNVRDAKGRMAIKTHAGPGESFHQHGLAYDCAPLVEGRILWDPSHWTWKTIVAEGKALGLRDLSFEDGHFEWPGSRISDLMTRKYRAGE